MLHITFSKDAILIKWYNMTCPQKRCSIKYSEGRFLKTRQTAQGGCASTLNHWILQGGGSVQLSPAGTISHRRWCTNVDLYCAVQRFQWCKRYNLCTFDILAMSALHKSTLWYKCIQIIHHRHSQMEIIVKVVFGHHYSWVHTWRTDPVSVLSA